MQNSGLVLIIETLLSPSVLYTELSVPSNQGLRTLAGGAGALSSFLTTHRDQEAVISIWLSYLFNFWIGVPALSFLQEANWHSSLYSEFSSVVDAMQCCLHPQSISTISIVEQWGINETNKYDLHVHLTCLLNTWASWDPGLVLVCSGDIHKNFSVHESSNLVVGAPVNGCTSCGCQKSMNPALRYVVRYPQRGGT